jgi:hypothetical protein
VATLLTGAGVASAQPASSHVLARQSRLAGALRDGVARSPTLATLVETLDASNVLVHLYDGTCDASAESCLMLVSGRSSPRVVRVHFRLTSAGRNAVLERYDGLIAQIAHELQHAVEIASDVTVIDARTMAACFQRIGRGSRTARGTVYESEAALRVGRRVAEELRGRHRSNAGRRGGAVAGAAAPR